MRCLVAILLVVSTTTAFAADEDAREKRQQLEALRERIGALQVELARDIGERDRVTGELRETERELGQAAVALREINVRLRYTQERLQALEAEQRERRTALRNEREALANQVRAAYMAGREEKLKLLLNQQDPATLGRILAYYDYLNRARATRIENVNAQLSRLAALETEIDAELVVLDEARADRAAILADLEAARDQRATLLARLETEIRNRNDELSRLKADERALAELVQSLLDVFADIPDRLDGASFRDRRGQLPWPASGTVVAEFGDSRAGGRMQWNGMMIDAAPGTAVRAVSHGRVAYADWLPHYGLLMVIEHGDGYLSLYGHNQALYKEVGDWVEAGEIIAAIGDTGGQREAALYFEIRHGKRLEDPRRWLRGS